MKNENNYIYDVQNYKNDGYSDFQFISSWKTNYKSWKVQKKFPIKIIKYENLLNETFVTFKEVVKFINSIVFQNKKIDTQKLKNSVSSTFFDKLKNNEVKDGFSEAVTSKKTNKKIPFFYLGPKNDWKKILDKSFQKKIVLEFENECNELNYK